MNEIDMIKCQPKSVEDMTDLNDRMKAAVEFYNPKYKELLKEVESQFQITIQLGIDTQNPYAILPTFIPRNIKEYALKEETNVEPATESPTSE